MDSFLSGLPYSFPYVLLCACAASLFLLGEKSELSRKIAGIYAVAIYLVFFGFRGYVDTDWISYYEFFGKVLPLSRNPPGKVWQEMSAQPMEYGFYLLTSLIKSIFDDYRFWIFLNTAADILLLRSAFRKLSGEFLLGLVVFLAWGGMTYEMNLLRNIKSVLLFAHSLPCVAGRRWKPFLLLNLTGMLFHFSSAIFLPLYFILRLRLPKWFCWLVFLTGNAFFLLRIDPFSHLILRAASGFGGVVGEKITAYFRDGFYSAPFGITVGYLEKIAVFILVMIFYDRLMEAGKTNRVLVNTFLIYLFLYYFFSDINIIAMRGSFLFILSYWFLLPNMFRAAGSRRTRTFFAAGLILVSLLKIAVTYNQIIYKYDNYLWNADSRLERMQVYERHYHQIIRRDP